MKKISLVAFIGYLAGILIYWVENHSSDFNPICGLMTDFGLT